MARLAVDIGVLFYPRGGSSQVVGYTLRQLTQLGVAPRLHVGSLGKSHELSNASKFYRDIDIRPFDYTDAFTAFAHGNDAMGQDIPRPFHPSYEDRGVCPDKIFSAVSPTCARHLTAAWEKHFATYRQQAVDVLHLHHLSHLQKAAGRPYAGVPRVTTLHGTELKLLEGMRQRMALLAKISLSLADAVRLLAPDSAQRSRRLNSIAALGLLTEAEYELLAETRWNLWQYSPFWITEYADYVRHAGKIFTVSEHDSHKAVTLLGLKSAPPVIPNGVDSAAFTPKKFSKAQKLALLQEWLVDDPQGWKAGQEAGSIRYTVADLERFVTDKGNLKPILLWCGRFLDFKRIPLLFKAYAKAYAHVQRKPILLMWGGYPGEYEGDHPYDMAKQAGIEDSVFFIGWRGHDDLPNGLNCADAMIAPALNEPFGMVYIEAMACGVPPIASRSGGPAKIITASGPHANGWLAKPDDVQDLTRVIIEVLEDTAEVARRASHGVRHVRATYSWLTVAQRYADIYQEIAET